MKPAIYKTATFPLSFESKNLPQAQSSAHGLCSSTYWVAPEVKFQENHVDTHPEHLDLEDTIKEDQYPIKLVNHHQCHTKLTNGRMVNTTTLQSKQCIW